MSTDKERRSTETPGPVSPDAGEVAGSASAEPSSSAAEEPVAAAAEVSDGDMASPETAVSEDGGEASVNAEDAAEAENQGAEAEPPHPLQLEVERLQTQLNELRQSLLRVHADFDNYRKRTRQEMEELRQYAARELLRELLPVADNFDRALDAFASGNVEEIRTGVEMVRRQLASVLEKHGVTPMECVGTPFDPSRHEAVMQEPADGREAGVVVEELQKGYMLHDKVLRPALVKVTV